MLRIPAAAVAQGQAAARNNPSAAGTDRGVPGGQSTSQRNTGTATHQPGGPTQPASGVNNQDERYIYHRVQRGETLGMIASEYGISVRDLKRANKGLLFPHEGRLLF